MSGMEGMCKAGELDNNIVKRGEKSWWKEM